MCMAGTPIEDAYRHGQTVAVAMLQAAGGLRQENAEVCVRQFCFVCQTLMLCSHSITDHVRGSLTKPESELLEYFVWALYCCVGTLIDANTRTPARGNGRKSSFRHGAHSAKGTAQQGERSRSGALSARLRANAYAM